MLLHQFHRLTESTQYHHLLLKGVCVADYSTDSDDRLLFQLNDYYVEVIFQRHTDSIVGLQCFRDTHALDPYLEAICIKSLLSLIYPTKSVC